MGIYRLFNNNTFYFTGGLPSPLALLVSGNDVFISLIFPLARNDFFILAKISTILPSKKV